VGNGGQLNTHVAAILPDCAGQAYGRIRPSAFEFSVEWLAGPV
jgi:hypothetical protein